MTHRHRLVIPRRSEGSVPPAEAGLRRVDPPSLIGVRLVFGVAGGPETTPSAEDFHPAYTVAMPVVSAGGLDPDGIYEFDAGAQLELLQARATRRRWAVRLELELLQSSEALNTAELWIDTPWTEAEDPKPLALEPLPGPSLPGGGRAVILASTPVTRVDAARSLGGRFEARLRDADPHGGGPASVESPALIVELDLRRYEFEAEDDDSDG